MLSIRLHMCSIGCHQLRPRRPRELQHNRGDAYNLLSMEFRAVQCYHLAQQLQFLWVYEDRSVDLRVVMEERGRENDPHRSFDRRRACLVAACRL